MQVSQHIGVVCAGGSGSRLRPITEGINKHLLPVHNKPMIYYPLSLLMLLGIRDICVVTTPRDIPSFFALLGDGSQWGIRVRLAEQCLPDGIVGCIKTALDPNSNAPATVALGDNLFFGAGLGSFLRQALKLNGAVVFTSTVLDASSFAVVEWDAHGHVKDIEEKPALPRSKSAVTGLYMYPRDVRDRMSNIAPSRRGELEITDLNTSYLRDSALHARALPRGTAWLDCGTLEGLHEANSFVRTLEARQGLLIGSPEEVAWRQGWLTANEVRRIAQDHYKSSDYGTQLLQILT